MSIRERVRQVFLLPRQFYTPAEVSRVIAQVIGIRNAKTSAATTVTPSNSS